jgi:catechol 1,2-dioxygenase
LGLKADAYKEIQFDIELTPLVLGKDNQLVHRPRVAVTP